MHACPQTEQCDLSAWCPCRHLDDFFADGGHNPEATGSRLRAMELCRERTNRGLELHLGHAATLSLDRSTVDRPDGAGGAPRPVGPPGDQATTESLETPPDLREVDRIPAPLRIDHGEALLGVGEQEP
jgi:hypothetical protein